MSGIARNKTTPSRDLVELSKAIIYNSEPVKAVERHKEQIDTISSNEVIALVDELVDMNIPLDILKKGSTSCSTFFIKPFPMLRILN